MAKAHSFYSIWSRPRFHFVVFEYHFDLRSWHWLSHEVLHAWAERCRSEHGIRVGGAAAHIRRLYVLESRELADLFGHFWSRHPWHRVIDEEHFVEGHALLSMGIDPCLEQLNGLLASHGSITLDVQATEHWLERENIHAVIIDDQNYCRVFYFLTLQCLVRVRQLLFRFSLLSQTERFFFFQLLKVVSCRLL